MKSIVGLIPARGGSKGVPGKNIKPLGGKPLIAWTIDASRASGLLDRVLVSTDDPAIAEIARRCGAEVPSVRPASLAADETPALDVALHALDWLESQGALPECLLWLQPTSPFRTSEDIAAGIALMEHTAAPAIVGVCEARVHPLYVVKINPEGALEPFMPGATGKTRRQDLPDAYQVNGAFYLIRSLALRQDRSFFPKGTRPLIMPQERSIDIDSAWDFFVAQTMLAPLRGFG